MVDPDINVIADDDDLTLSWQWESALDEQEIAVYKTLAKVANGELRFTALKALAFDSGQSKNGFMNVMYQLQKKELLRGLTERD